MQIIFEIDKNMFDFTTEDKFESSLVCLIQNMLQTNQYLFGINTPTLTRETVPSQTSDMGKKSVSVLAH